MKIRKFNFHRIYLLGFLAGLSLNNSALAQLDKARPNVLVIFADDLGWADLGCYGSTFYETPNLDDLAKGGIKFNHGYATSPVCSPTRASLMTGKYPTKTGITDWIPGRQAEGKVKPYEKMIGPATAYELALQETTLAEHLQQQGYKTFFAGKWHLGEEEKYWPEFQGFQTNLGGWSKGAPYGKKNDTTGGFFTPYSNPRLTDGPPGEYITDRLANECIKFIDGAQSEPFFMLYSLYAVHNPMQAPTHLVKKYEEKRKGILQPEQNPLVKDEPWMEPESGWRRRTVQEHAVYAAMVENMDTNIGKIIAKLREKGLLENTLIIFTSDNGGLSTAEGSPTVNGHLRAGKGWLYEGGTRVPFIMYWKGKIMGGNSTDLPVTVADIFPTIAKSVDSGFKPTKAMDGKDIFSLMKDSATQKDRTLYWHYPHYSNQGGRPGASIRQGKWKLIYNYEDSSTELYDLTNDPGEKVNVSKANQKTTELLKKHLMKWLKDTKATSPQINSAYKPTTSK
jgi:arylsulfatase A-like enzyme